MDKDASDSLAPTQRFSWPFTPKRDVTAESWFAALARSPDGFYPLGRNGFWHGGVHLHAGTIPAVSDDPTVRCIADGEVVAYRVDGCYPTVEYPDAGEASYSTGFVLVRHRLQAPPISNASASAEPPQLELYSLYMHLQDWDEYQSDESRERPAFWASVADSFVVGSSANDPNPFGEVSTDSEGINVRRAGRGSPIIGWLPRGTRLTVENGAGAWRDIRSIDSGSMVAAPDVEAAASAPLGTVFTGELSPAAAEPHAKDAVHVLDQPVSIKAGDVIGHLGVYQRHQDLNPLSGEAADRRLIHLEIFSTDDVPAFLDASRSHAARLDDASKTLLLIEPGARLSQPGDADVQLGPAEGVIAETASADVGQWVQARKAVVNVVARSSLSGYDSTTHTYSGGAVLLRMFDATATNAIDLNAFNALDAAGKAGYPNREVLVPTADRIWVAVTDLDQRGLASGQEIKGWSSFPLALDDGGPQAGEARVLPIKQVGSTATDDEERSWFQVDVQGEDGLSTTGWVREADHPKVRRCSPWEWPGFDVLDAGNVSPAAYYAHHLSTHPATEDDERQDLLARGSDAAQSPLIKRLNELVDANKDGHLSTAEITAAMSHRGVADILSRLVVKHPSEWSRDSGDWNEVDALVGENGAADWVAEKARIEGISWLQSVAQIIPADVARPTVTCNIHPVGLIGAFNALSAVTIEMLQQIFTTASDERLRSIRDEVNRNIEEYRLDSALRLSHFFAQVREEVGNSASFSESLNYSPAGLIATFSYFSQNSQEAHEYGRTSAQAANQEAIANRAYGGRNGNGDISTGDGWRYRGRGLKMTTGRSNYQDLQDNYRIVWPGRAPDFVGNPDLLGTARYAVQSAVFFWVRHGLYRIADGGAVDANVDSITSIINRHTASYAARRSHFTSIWDARVFASIDK